MDQNENPDLEQEIQTEEVTEIEETPVEETPDEPETVEAEPEEEEEPVNWKNEAAKWRRIAEKKEKEDKEPAPKKEAPAPSQDSSDRLDRIELLALGVHEDEEQDFILKSAKVLDIAPAKALRNPVVSAHLKALREDRKTSNATPAPTKQTGRTSNNLDYLVQKAMKDGKLPDDPALADKVEKELIKRSQNNR